MRSAPRWIAAYLIVVAAFLAMVARYYHPAYGFTAFLELPAASHDRELPAIRSAPHFDHPRSTGYDGQFYSQMAVDPLLRDPAIDQALDNPPYRAHRILFSWIAWTFGAGRPVWILQAASLENVLAWLALAWVLARLIPPASARHFVLWAGCLLGHGTLMSVRYALPDGLSLLMIVGAALLVERGRPILASAVTGLAGLARETSLLAATTLLTFIRRSPRSWWLVAGCFLVCLAPLALWLDYLRSIYLDAVLTGGEHMTKPLSGFLWKAKSIERALSSGVLTAATRDDVLAFVAFLTQAIWIIWTIGTRRSRSAWILIGCAFLVLTMIAYQPVWDGTPGAYTRIAMPLTIAVNVLLGREDAAPWWLIGLANLSIIPGVALMHMFRW